MSFTLAGRLAAHAATISPVDGAQDDWAKLAAWVMCLLLDMLIYLCEALDAGAARNARPASSASRDDRRAPAPATRAGHQALPSKGRARRPGLLPVVHLMAPQSAAPSQASETIPAAPWLAWSPDPAPPRPVLASPVPASPGRPPPRNAVFLPDVTHAHSIAIS